MNKEELSKWFIDKMNSCYLVNHTECINRVFLFYDEAIIRKMKLCKLNNVEFKLNKITGKCLFEIDFSSNKFWCDYFNVWKFFEINYNNIDTKIERLIKDILKEQNKLNMFNDIQQYQKLNKYIFEDFYYCTASLADNIPFIDVSKFKFKKYIFNSDT